MIKLCASGLPLPRNRKSRRHERGGGITRALTLQRDGCAFAQNGQFVQLSARSMEAIRTGSLVPGDAGFFRMTTISDGGKFLQQLLTALAEIPR